MNKVANFPLSGFPDLLSPNEFFDSFRINNLSVDDFLKYNPENIGTNRERIFKSLTNQDKASLGISLESQINESNCKMRSPLLLQVPRANVDVAILKKEEKHKERRNDYSAFLSAEIEEILNNPEFITSELRKSIPKTTVWFWCKSLGSSDGDITGGLIDITPFLMQVNTGVTKTGGNFSIMISELICEWNEDSNHWILKKDSMISSDEKAIISKNILLDNTSNRLKRNKFYFSNVIATNDLVFISFDRLSLSNKTFIRNKGYNFSISKQDIPNNVFDMIGLVDASKCRYVPGNVDLTFNLGGRDCMKLLIDDGTFFFPNSYANTDSNKGVFNNINDNKSGDGVSTVGIEGNVSRESKRLYDSDFIEAFFTYEERTIRQVLEILISTLSNIRICDDDLFSSYGDRRTKFRKV